MDGLLLNLVGGIPLVTRIWALGTVALSVLTATGIVEKTATLYTYDLVFKKGQYYRLFYALFDYGGFSWASIFYIIISVNHLSSLESSFTRRSRFLWLCLFLFSSIVATSKYVQPLDSLGLILHENLVYYMVRKDLSANVRNVGGFSFISLLIPLYSNLATYISYQCSLKQVSLNFLPGHIAYFFDKVLGKIYGIDFGKPPTDLIWGNNEE